MICKDCQDAAAITSKNLSELKQTYENMMFMGVAKYQGTFEDYIAETHRRSEHLHNRCKGGTHCDCQHKVQNVIRDLT